MRAIALFLIAALIAGCAPRRVAAPVEDRRPPPPRAAVPSQKPPAAPVGQQTPSVSVPDGYYAVKRGDTLYSIALEHGVDYRELAQWNSLDDPTKLRVGQVLRVKPPAEPSVVLGPGRAPGRIESRPLETQTAPPAAVPPAVPPVAREEPKLEVHPIQFLWPAKGKLLAGFAEPRQKGIDIEGKIGDPVIAAAAGRVTYVGSGIPGLGKLVVIRHDQGFITVYANNKDILVKEQQAVARGQRIAELGEKLHFQIRKGAAAVDPLLYLPKS